MRLQKRWLLPVALILLVIASAGQSVLAEGSSELAESVTEVTIEMSSAPVANNSDTTAISDSADTGDASQAVSGADGNQTRATDSRAEGTATTESDANPVNSKQSVQTLKAPVPMPQVLVGTWVAYNPRTNWRTTFTINADGSGVRKIEGGGVVTTDPFKIDQVQEVAPGLYRYVGGENIMVTNSGGLGGFLVKYDHGFAIIDGHFVPVVWQTHSQGAFDYSQPMYGSYFTRLADNQQTSEQVQPTVQPAVSEKSSRPTSAPTLPKTGEQSSSLLMVSGLALVAAAYRLRKKGIFRL